MHGGIPRIIYEYNINKKKMMIEPGFGSSFHVKFSLYASYIYLCIYLYINICILYIYNIYIYMSMLTFMSIFQINPNINPKIDPQINQIKMN